MKKSDLKDGYLVKYRNGKVAEVKMLKKDNDEEIMIFADETGFSILVNYDENFNYNKSKDFDIMGIYGYPRYYQDTRNPSTNHREILWERKEPPKKNDEPVKLSINDFAKSVHENAVAHGWWEKEPSFAEIIALCHSELSEALDEDRMNNPNVCFFDDDDEISTDLNVYTHYSDLQGRAVEMIDCVLRILDWCAKEDVDIEKIMTLKHEYNKTRPYKHGKKY